MHTLLQWNASFLSTTNTSISQFSILSPALPYTPVNGLRPASLTRSLAFHHVMSHTPRSLISLCMLPSPTASLSTSCSFTPSLMLHSRRVLRRERYKHLFFVSTSPMHPRTHIHTLAALSHAPFVSHVPHTHLFPKPYTRTHACTVFSSYSPLPPYTVSYVYEE